MIKVLLVLVHIYLYHFLYIPSISVRHFFTQRRSCRSASIVAASMDDETSEAAEQDIQMLTSATQLAIRDYVKLSKSSENCLKMVVSPFQ
ncbi:unnamed protein product [Adineta ricciae]|uniref:Uncharacterized protein n=1 Tax=Adineta ricciae TaxID=249248 RepID=A0A814WGE5_ADIRI|nr:unnamed protein product [Adineta ricciae]